MDTGVDYNSHSALISYFNIEAKKEGFLQNPLTNNHINDSIYLAVA